MVVNDVVNDAVHAAFISRLTIYTVRLTLISERHYSL